MPLKLAELVDLIVTKSGKSKDEVIKLIEAKKQELNGYVTDEGAASLVARELDLDLFERQTTPELKLSVRDLVTGMTGVSLNLKVQRIFPVRTFTRKQGGEGKVASLTGADATGRIRVTFWDKHTQPIEDKEIDEGDIVRIINGRVRTGLRDQLELHLGSGSRIMVSPPDIDMKDFPEVTLPLTQIASLKEGMFEVNVEGTIRAKYRKTVFSRGDSEGTVASFSLGDETGQTRLVLWDEQAEWFDKLSVDESIKIENGYTRLDQNQRPELHVGRRGRITVLKGKKKRPSKPKTSPAQHLKDFQPGDYATALGVMVIENQGVSTFTRRDGQEGKRLVLRLADETGQVRAVAWGRAAEGLANLQEGTILRLEGVGFRAGLRQELELHINESSQVLQNPPKIKFGSTSPDLIMVAGTEATHQVLADVTEGNFVMVRGTIVQVIRQRLVYDACPSCSRKASTDGSQITCPSCGTIKNTEPRLLAKVLLDDGTENMRASFIGVSAEKLLGMTGAEAKKLLEEAETDDEPFSRIEQTLLGEEVIVSGRIRLNTFSNELEIAVNQIQEVNPVEVANRLIKDMERKVKS